jgi:molybdopterin converting factor small subunit
MHVEFFGVPREHAGMPALDVQAGTLGELLKTLAARNPSLGKLIATDRLHPSFVANLNGDRFVSDPATLLGENDCVLILSADAGG